jgi:trypsin
LFDANYILGIPIPGEVEPKDERIVGGKSLSIKQVPFIISLQNLGMHMCGGSIINENTIITAAHCTNGYLNKKCLIQI